MGREPTRAGLLTQGDGRTVQVVILGNVHKSRVQPAAEHVRRVVQRYAELVAYDLKQEMDLSTVRADLVIVLGGDGAILRAAHQMGTNQMPVMGVNLGKLGFLAEVAPEEFETVFRTVLDGNYQVLDHLMLLCRLRTAETACRAELLSLNEVVVQAGPPFRMVEVELSIDGEQVASFAGDGLILATPVGSTAHSLAAGGPILRQDIAAVVITPLCPHTLTARPLVDAAERLYTLTVRPSVLPSSAFLVVDGIQVAQVGPGDVIEVRAAPVRFRLIQLRGRSYYRRLREKLGWGGDPRR